MPGPGRPGPPWRAPAWWWAVRRVNTVSHSPSTSVQWRWKLASRPGCLPAAETLSSTVSSSSIPSTARSASTGCDRPGRPLGVDAVDRHLVRRAASPEPGGQVLAGEVPAGGVRDRWSPRASDRVGQHGRRSGSKASSVAGKRTKRSGSGGASRPFAHDDGVALEDLRRCGRGGGRRPSRGRPRWARRARRCGPRRGAPARRVARRRCDPSVGSTPGRPSPGVRSRDAAGARSRRRGSSPRAPAAPTRRRG